MAAWYALADFFLSRLDAETAHGLALRALKSGLLPADRRADPPSLAVKVWGRTLPNPIGLAAGFDKNAEVPDALLGLGFGLVEIGSVTPRPQDGNPRPRLFRLRRGSRRHQPHGLSRPGARRRALAARHPPAPRLRRRQCRRQQGQHRPRRRLRRLQRGAGALRRLSRVQRLLAQHAGPAQPAGPHPARRPPEARAGRHRRQAGAAAGQDRARRHGRRSRRYRRRLPRAQDGRHHRRQHDAVAARRRCVRHGARRPAGSPARRSGTCRPRCCAARRSASNASSR